MFKTVFALFALLLGDRMNAGGNIPLLFMPLAQTTCVAGSQTFVYTGADQTLTVPAGCSMISVKMWGAAGTALTPAAADSRCRISA